MSIETPHTLASADDAAISPAERGGNLRVSLACPKCEREGWVAWQNLGHTIGCPGCKTKFQIGRQGKLELRSDTPRVRYQCPRCLQSGELPAKLAVRGVECGACQLTLVVGPDQQLHDETAAKQLRKSRRDQSHAQRVAAQYNTIGNTSYFQPAKFLTAAGVLLAILVLGFLGYRMLRGPTPEERVEAFTAQCLAGDWNAALQFVMDDPVQQAEFARWRVRHFSSILDKHRPQGDRMSIQPELLGETPEGNTYRVVLSSQLIGRRTHQQIWRITDGQWQFDVLATLALANPSAAKSIAEQEQAPLTGHAEPQSSQPKPKPRLPNNPYSRKR